MTRAHKVEIRELKESGLDDESLKFSSFKLVDDFLNAYPQYSNSIVQKSNHNQLRMKYVLHDFSDTSKAYIVYKVDGQIIPTKEDIRRFYKTDTYKRRKNLVANVRRMSRSEIHEAQERQKQRRRLLLLIDVKYGGIDHADGTPELREFRKMIGAEDEI